MAYKPSKGCLSHNDILLCGNGVGGKDEGGGKNSRAKNDRDYGQGTRGLRISPGRIGFGIGVRRNVQMYR